MKIFTLPNFELNKRFEYSTGPSGLKALSDWTTGKGAQVCFGPARAVTFLPPVSLY